MACAKPPDLDRITEPKPVADVSLYQTDELFDHAEFVIGRATSGDVLTPFMEKAERSLKRLRNAGLPDHVLRQYEGRLARLKGLANDRFQAIANGTENIASKVGKRGGDRQKTLREYSVRAAEKNAKTAREALTRPGHWAHKNFKTQLFKTIEHAGKIPDAYKDSLLNDTAMLLQVCPEAGGLVAAMTTRGQPRRTFSERLDSKGNDAVGAAYEIMGTAALCSKESRSANQRHDAPSLRIDPQKDRLVFGNKAYLNHEHKGNGAVSERKRHSIESDAQIFKDGREIGIDFKHVKDAKTKGASKDFRNQVEAVAGKIRDGELSEYHFVTNGKFSGPFKEYIDTVNDALVAAGGTPISYHEGVTTLSDDPWAGERPD